MRSCARSFKKVPISPLGKVVATEQKVPISVRALIQRVYRELRHNGEVLKIARGSRAELESDVGRYFIVNMKRNSLVNDHCDPEAVGSRDWRDGRI
jgi:hypothetical protein